MGPDGDGDDDQRRQDERHAGHQQVKGPLDHEVDGILQGVGVDGQDGHIAHRLQLELAGYRPAELRHVVEIDGIVVGNADHARHVLVILDVGHGTEHLIHLVGLDKLLNVVEGALIGRRCRPGARIVVKEAHDVVTVALVAQHLVDEAHAHRATADDDDTLEVEAAVAVQLDKLAGDDPPHRQGQEEEDVITQHDVPWRVERHDKRRQRDEDAGVGEHELQGMAHQLVGIEHAPLVHLAVEVDAHHHRHVEDEPDGTGVHLIHACRPAVMPHHRGKVGEVGNQQVDGAEYPSDELSVSAFTLHEGTLWYLDGNRLKRCVKTHLVLTHLRLVFLVYLRLRQVVIIHCRGP